MISDAEAKRLGIELRRSDAQASDFNAESTAAQTGIADRMRIGKTEFRDVFVLVRPADRTSWKEWPAGRQGILRLPLLVALDALRWTRDDRCDTGSPARHDPSSRAERNLE
jgi:hypothetical protein